MSWQFFFTYPLNTNLYEWVYSSSPLNYDINTWTKSEQFLVVLGGHVIDESYLNTSAPGYVKRNYFLNYCQIAEFEYTLFFPNTEIQIGTKRNFRPLISATPQNREFYIPFIQKENHIFEGRVIGIRRVARRSRPNRYIGYTPNDKMILDVYQWIK